MPSSHCHLTNNSFYLSVLNIVPSVVSNCIYVCWRDMYNKCKRKHGFCSSKGLYFMKKAINVLCTSYMPYLGLSFPFYSNKSHWSLRFSNSENLYRHVDFWNNYGESQDNLVPSMTYWSSQRGPSGPQRKEGNVIQWNEYWLWGQTDLDLNPSPCTC